MRRALAAAVVAGAVLGVQAAQAPDDLSRTAWQQIDLASGRVLEASQARSARRPRRPGVLHEAADADRGAREPASSRRTRGHLSPARPPSRGELVRCSHPRCRHALRPDEALALSCNVYFATHRRAAVTRAARRRAHVAGPAADACPAPMPLVATGLKGDADDARRAAARTLAIRARRSRGCRSTRRSDTWSSTGCAAPLSTARPAPLRCAASRRWRRRAPPTRRAAAAGAGRRRLARGVAHARDRPARTRRRGHGRRRSGGEARRSCRCRACARRRPPQRATVPAPVAATRRGGRASRRDDAARRRTPGPGGGYDVRTIPLEDYVARVLAGEAAPHSPRRRARGARHHRRARLPSSIADATSAGRVRPLSR